MPRETALHWAIFHSSETPNMVSSSSLFHFTSYASLVKILRGKALHAYYSVENALILKKDTPVAIRMVCFCDIRLREVGPHSKRYGGCGIGLRKPWGTQNAVNPVLYVDEKSYLFSAIRNLNRFFLRNISKQDGVMKVHMSADESKAYSEFLLLFGHAKLRRHREWVPETNSFSGSLTDFYQEREWRFVPKPDEPTEGMHPINFYPVYRDEDATTSVKVNNSNYPPPMLKFSLDDVSHLVVGTKTEKVKLLKELKALRCSATMRDHLVSSIVLLKDVGKNI